jgi:signal peptidase II
MKKNSSYLALIAVLVIADQITKSLVVRWVGLYSSRAVIPGFFNITRIHNKGAIFGAFSQTSNHLVFLLLTAASLIALGLVVYYFIKTPASDWKIKLALSLILAGALGNFVDRVFRGSVVEFLDFYVNGWHWPFFNVADSCITVGAVLLITFFVFRKPSCSQSSSA